MDISSFQGSLSAFSEASFTGYNREIIVLLNEFRETKNPYLGIYVFQRLINQYGSLPPDDLIRWVAENFRLFTQKQGSIQLDEAFNLKQKDGKGKTKPTVEFFTASRNEFIAYHMTILVKVLLIPIKTAKGMVRELLELTTDQYAAHWPKIAKVAESTVEQIYKTMPEMNGTELMHICEDFGEDRLKARDYLRQYNRRSIPESIIRKHKL